MGYVLKFDYRFGVSGTRKWPYGLGSFAPCHGCFGRDGSYHEIRERLFLKGFNSLLVLASKEGFICNWHYLFNEDGSRIRYTDSRVWEFMPLGAEDINTYESWIGTMRHSVGWCSDVQWLICKLYISHVIIEIRA